MQNRQPCPDKGRVCGSRTHVVGSQTWAKCVRRSQGRDQSRSATSGQPAALSPQPQNTKWDISIHHQDDGVSVTGLGARGFSVIRANKLLRELADNYHKDGIDVAFAMSNQPTGKGSQVAYELKVTTPTVGGHVVLGHVPAKEEPTLYAETEYDGGDKKCAHCGNESESYHLISDASGAQKLIADECSSGVVGVDLTGFLTREHIKDIVAKSQRRLPREFKDGQDKNVDDLLAATFAQVRLDGGYRSGSGGTAGQVMFEYETELPQRLMQQVTSEDRAKAREFRAALRRSDKSSNEYMSSLSEAVQNDTVTVADALKLVGSVSQSDRLLAGGSRTDDQTKKHRYVGEPGDSLANVEATIVSNKKFSGQYGESNAVTLETPDGGRMLVFTNAALGRDGKEGDRVRLSGKVKRNQISSRDKQPESLVTLARGKGATEFI